VNINRTLAIMFGAAVISAASVSAQQKPTEPARPAAVQTDKPVTYIGCLSPGTAEDNFVLLKAEQKGQRTKAEDRLSLKIVPATPKVKLEPYVTQEVEITGTLGTPPAASDSSEQGETLQLLTATNVKWRANSCG
jgi:hypothetical protein